MTDIADGEDDESLHQFFETWRREHAPEMNFVRLRGCAFVELNDDGEPLSGAEIAARYATLAKRAIARISK